MMRSVDMARPDVNDLRTRFAKIRRGYLVSLTMIAKEIGISPTTLQKFIKGQVEAHYMTLCIIEDWLIEKEKKD